jgi:Tfp pilus assembly protein PilN
MIKINLARRKTANIASSTGDAGVRVFAGLKNLFSRGSSGTGSSSEVLKDLPIRSILIALAGMYGAEFYFDAEKSAELAKVEQQIEKLNVTQRELQATLAKSAGLEDVKRSLEADEKLVKTKLETILKLMQDRHGSIQALKNISMSIPSEVWLQSLSISETEFQAAGQAVDYNQVSDFMNRLGQADFLSELNLDGSSQVKDEKGLNVASFRLTAKRK